MMFKASCDLPSEILPALEDYLYEIAPSSWFIVEDEIKGLSQLIGYFTCKDNAISEISSLSEFSIFETDFQFDELADRDWKESYKAHFSPWNYKFFHLIPSWEKNNYVIPENDIYLYLDPGMAFGTGNHETTRMCIEFLIDHRTRFSKHETLIDLGCGSGILSLVAKRLGYVDILGVDSDPDAVRISNENALLNDISIGVDFKISDLSNMEIGNEKYDCIVANIQADILQLCSDQINLLAKDDSVIILSGILSQEIDEVIGTFLKNSSRLKNYKLKTSGEWSSVLFSRF